MSRASVGTSTSAVQTKAPPAFAVPAAQPAGFANPVTLTASTATSAAPLSATANESFTGWPATTRPSSASASNAIPADTSAAFS